MTPSDDSTAAPIGTLHLLRDALDRSEARFRLLAETIPQIVFISDTNAVIDYYNPQWYAYTGLSPQTMRPDAWVATIHPDDLPGVLAAWEAVRLTDAQWEAEYRLRRHDGVYRWHLGRSVPLRDATGAVINWFGLATDIDERKRAEARLAESERRLQLGLQLARMVAWEWDPHRNVVTASENFAEIYGLPDIAFAEEGYALLHPDDLAAHQSRQQRAIETAGEYHDTFRIIRPDTGAIVWIEERGVAVVDAEGTPLKLIGVAADITARKEGEAALRGSEQRFRELAEAMPQKIFTALPNGDVDYFNPQWTQFTGLSFEAIRDWGWVQFIHPDDVGENLRRWRRSIETGAPFEFEHRFRRADGAYRWHVSRAIPLRDVAGTVTKWVGANTDIDEQKRAEMALRAAEEQKEQFIAGVAHDLKTPLTTIKGTAQMLGRQLRRGDPDEVTRAIPRLQTIDDAATRIIGMIDDLLDAARVRGGYALDLARTPTDLVALVRHAIAACAEGGTHRFHLDSRESALIGAWDATRLERVVENLLSNACKYSPQGSDITVTVAREDGHETGAVLTVADAGIGIPAADLSHLFERFYRAANARGVPGSGIGLVGAKQIIEQHGGTIAITSEEGMGTTVIVRLPLG